MRHNTSSSHSTPPLFVIGSAISDFGELWNESLISLSQHVINESIASASLQPQEIQAVFVSNMAANQFEGQSHLSAIISSLFPHHPPAFRIEGACASGGLALLAAEHALLSNQYDTVMVLGVEKMTDLDASEVTDILAGASNMQEESLSTFPALYALLAQAHASAFGTTDAQRAAVSAINHTYAVDNPHAQFQKAISVDAVLKSPLIADPLRLLECSPISDGAAAVIISTRPPTLTHPHTSSTQIVGFGHGQDFVDLASRSSLTQFDATIRASRTAYSMAGATPKDIEYAEVHDCFSIGEILAVEDLGFCKKGTGGSFAERALAEQTLAQKTKTVVNRSGGLKACGHPVGATGVKQVAYLSQLLAAQTHNDTQSHIGLTHNVGGSGATAVVHILKSSPTSQKKKRKSS